MRRFTRGPSAVSGFVRARPTASWHTDVRCTTCSQHKRSIHGVRILRQDKTRHFKPEPLYFTRVFGIAIYIYIS